MGEEVFGAVPPMRGSFADLVAVLVTARHETAITTPEAAALVLPGLTVVQALRQHGFAPGARVLVIGASGGVGHLAVQVASARGAGLVVGVPKRRFVKSLGAGVLDYEALKPPDDDETGCDRTRWWRGCVRCYPRTAAPLRPGAGHRLEPRREDRAHAYKSRIRSVGRCSTTDRTPPTSTTT